MATAAPASTAKPPVPTATAAKPRATTQRSLTKNHSLEGDGLITGFYNFLYKRNTKTLKACKDVLVPDTIVYDHNFPRGWFTSDLKSKEISKKQGKELDAASIVSAFQHAPNPQVGVVAAYLCSYEEETGSGESETITTVEFFNERTLEEFVARKEKREGILQKFVNPKGLRNGIIQAVWSPHVCIVQRRTNRSSILNKLQCDKDPYPCCVTYEGPAHYSEEGSCALPTTDKIKKICISIVSHFFATEHKFITRMVLYFKVDERDQVWLLWCGSLRVSDREQPSQMPLNLAPKFNSPSLESGASVREESDLHEADQHHYDMTHDRLFHALYIEPTSPRGHDESGSHHHAGGTSHQSGDGADGSPSKSTKSGKTRSAAPSAATSTVAGPTRSDDDWHKLPGIQDQYQALCIDRENVLSALDDVFYEAYGHFLRHEPGAFTFEVDKSVSTALGPDVLQELMQHLRIEHALQADDAGAASIDDEELCFAIMPNHVFGPMTKVGDAAARWVNAWYDRRIFELREEAAAVPQSSIAADETATTAATTEPAAKPAAAEPAPAAAA